MAQKPEVDKGVWVLRQTKNKRTHRVPLAPLAAEIMSRRKGSFSSHAATRAWGRVREQLNLADVRVHDLRRTMASRMAELGIDRVVIAKCLNHVSIHRATVTGAVYDRYNYEKEKRAAFEAWENDLLTIIRGA